MDGSIGTGGMRCRGAGRGIEADFGPEHADTFRRDLHPDLRADYVLANPPFNDSDWFRKDDDVRWQYGVPPRGNANFAWVQHFIHHLAPHGMAGFVLANGSYRPPTSPAKATSAAPSSKPTSSTTWSAFPARSFIQLRSRLPLVLQKRNSRHLALHGNVGMQ
jgi:N-6 DNA Methylase